MLCFLFTLLMVMVIKSLIKPQGETKTQIYLDCYGYQENCVPTPDKQVPKQVDLNINWKR